VVELWHLVRVDLGHLWRLVGQRGVRSPQVPQGGVRGASGVLHRKWSRDLTHCQCLPDSIFIARPPSRNRSEACFRD
jgi:hypothetical protein